MEERWKGKVSCPPRLKRGIHIYVCSKRGIHIVCVWQERHPLHIYYFAYMTFPAVANLHPVDGHTHVCGIGRLPAGCKFATAGNVM